MEGRIQIDRVAVKNFRSIQECDVALEPLTFFIGANASGKTSFVDAILFVASALRDSLQKAIADRGGLHSILHQPNKLPANLQFDLYLSSANSLKCEFHVRLQIAEGWSVSVTHEECRIRDSRGASHHYLVENGAVTGSASVFPPASIDRMFLKNASGLPEFRLLYDFLSGIGSTEPTLPGTHFALQLMNGMTRRLSPGTAPSGLAYRFRNIIRDQPERFEIVQQYLRVIAPPFDRIQVYELNDELSLRFLENSRSGAAVPFHLKQASAGLVSSAEILLELFDLPQNDAPACALVVEEPEAFLHPAAIQVLRDSFIEASRTRQVIVTTHSPDLLDDPIIHADWIRAVYRDDSGTHIETLDPGTESIIRDHLYTPGQLLRQGGLILKS